MATVTFVKTSTTIVIIATITPVITVPTITPIADIATIATVTTSQPPYHSIGMDGPPSSGDGTINHQPPMEKGWRGNRVWTQWYLRSRQMEWTAKRVVRF